MEGTVKRGKKAYATAVPASSYKVQELKRSQLFNCTIDNLSKAFSKLEKLCVDFFLQSDPHGRELGLNLTRNDLLFVNVMIRKNLANDSIELATMDTIRKMKVPELKQICKDKLLTVYQGLYLFMNVK